MDFRFIDDIAARVTGAMPPGARALKDDFEKNVRAILHSSFERLDLVTRTEFDAQTKVLTHARAKLAELETRVSALERHEKGEKSE